MAQILLIEDSLDLAGIVARELERCGHAVSVEADGEQGLLAFQSRRPDLLVIDWMLPGISGLEVLRQVRAASTVPVLMLTARGDLADRVAGLELGADDYLVKPFDLPELTARVHALLRRAGQVQQIIAQDRSTGGDRLAWRGLSLSPGDHTCSRDGTPLELTRLEFDLLELLLKNPGRVFNRRYLQETVWNQPYLEGDRSIDNTVMRLRRKLGPYGDLIETVREVGYRLKTT